MKAWWRYSFKPWIDRRIEKFWMFLAWSVLPRKLAYWACIRVMSHATQGQWSNQIVPELMAMDVLKRWDERNNDGKDSGSEIRRRGSGFSTEEAQGAERQCEGGSETETHYACPAFG